MTPCSQEFCRRHLVAATLPIRDALRGQGSAEPSRPAAVPAGAVEQALQEAWRERGGPPVILEICQLFGLSPFERDVLLLCAAAQIDPLPAPPTVGLAMEILPGGDLAAFSPAAPLHRCRLIDLQGAPAWLDGVLRLEDRVLCHLLGVSFLDQRLQGLVCREPDPAGLAPSHEALAGRLAGLLRADPPPLVQLCGAEPATRRQVAARAAALLGLGLHVLHADDAPPVAADRELFCRLWEREAALGAAALLIECDAAGEGSEARVAALALGARIERHVFLSSGEPLRGPRRPALRVDVARPSAEEQRLLWGEALGPLAERMNGHLDRLVGQFSLGLPEIRAARALADQGSAGPEAALWDACRAQARPLLGDLAQRIDPIAAWEDLVLPAEQTQVLQEIVVHVRHRSRVYGAWGFAGQGGRGLGISALFAGSSGTGKTMAAEVLARELQLDLYRIDLSQVISKYIGETEKSLRRVFDAAETGGAILLFDEADAIFGKRSEVKDSHDRYANIEVSYLLQRMEEYRGLAILTTNQKGALDTAFLRRIRFIVHFPFPDPAQRAEIWRRAFPRSTPTEGLDAERLARLQVAGGSIRNIALAAAFHAADRDEPVQMRHLLHAARGEYAKIERALTEQEMGGWT